MDLLMLAFAGIIPLQLDQLACRQRYGSILPSGSLAFQDSTAPFLRNTETAWLSKHMALGIS